MTLISKKPALEVWPQDPSTEGDRQIYSAHLQLGQQAIAPLWYRLPQRYRASLSPNSDPFVAATVLLAMTTASQLVIHGEVSPTLLRNVEEFQHAWASWLPHRLSVVPIVADREQDRSPSPAAPVAIAPFSGGVDSSYTAYCHSQHKLGRRSQPLKAGLFVHGFDIPLAQADAFNRAADSAATMLGSIGVELIPMATNFRQIMDAYVPWETSFGSAIASCLLVLQGGFSTGLIPSSYSYRNLTVPYGSNAVTDPLLGHDAFPIRYDGADCNRFAKIQALMEWPEALENIRVCWQGAQKDRNCCQCEKCIRNILTFRLAGAGLPPCFETDASDRQIQALRLRGGALDSLIALRDSAHRNGIQAPWVKAVATAIRRSRRKNFLRNRLKTPLEQRLVAFKKKHV
ncbi:MAG: hypothetical protein AAGF66_12395 [Cyanobacteria bacterium P01_H01_bin.119]